MGWGFRVRVKVRVSSGYLDSELVDRRDEVCEDFGPEHAREAAQGREALHEADNNLKDGRDLPGLGLGLGVGLGVGVGVGIGLGLCLGLWLGVGIGLTCRGVLGGSRARNLANGGQQPPSRTCAPVEVVVAVRR